MGTSPALKNGRGDLGSRNRHDRSGADTRKNPPDFNIYYNMCSDQGGKPNASLASISYTCGPDVITRASKRVTQPHYAEYMAKVFNLQSE